MEGDVDQNVLRLIRELFQSTPSAWRETLTEHSFRSTFPDFNPLPPHGGRPAKTETIWFTFGFQSTPSAWRETLTNWRIMGAGDISIHSLRMEGDVTLFYFYLCTSHFNPLPPHGGRRWLFSSIHTLEKISIHSLRMEGDLFTANFAICYFHFNPLPPHGGRPAPMADSMVYGRFQSTPSAWRETDLNLVGTLDHSISIHSLRMEGDFTISSVWSVLRNFNPLPPHGGRPGNDRQFSIRHFYFNPLPPHGGRRNRKSD